MIVVMIAVVLSCSVLVTIHIVGSFLLTRRRPSWSGAIGFVVPPLFPYYAMRQHERGWAFAWCAAALAYAAALSVALTWR